MTSPRDILRIVINAWLDWRNPRRGEVRRNQADALRYLREATDPRPPTKLARSTSPARLGGIPRETVRTPLTVALEARLTAACVTRSHELARRDILVRGNLEGKQ